VDYVPIKIPNILSSQPVDPREANTEVNEILPKNHFGGAHFLAFALRKVPESGTAAGCPMMLGLPSVGDQASDRLVAVLYLQAKGIRFFRQILPDFLPLATIFAKLLDRTFTDVEIVHHSCARPSTGPELTIKNRQMLMKIRSLNKAIQTRRRSNWVMPHPLAELKIEGLIPAGESSVVMRGDQSGEAVGVKAIPLRLPRSITTSRLHLELAICVSVHHEHIVPTLAFHQNVSERQIEDRCPDCTCPPRGSCRRHQVADALRVKREALRISSWDLMIMEHCEGTLHSLIHERRLFRDPANHGILILTLIDMAKGMCYLHDIGIVHGDLKPENVLCSRRDPSEGDPREWKMKVADFGTSRLGDEDHWAPPDGTLAYKPPEYMLGRASLRNLRHADGCAGDVYSFGITVWEMVEEKAPFDDFKGDPIDLQCQVQRNNRRPQFAANWPKPLKELLKRCWDPRPQSRPNFTEIVGELQSLQSILQ